MYRSLTIIYSTLPRGISKIGISNIGISWNIELEYREIPKPFRVEYFSICHPNIPLLVLGMLVVCVATDTSSSI